MQQFCPLCSKRGFRRKIKALQINFNEALWTCEGEECEWPFGYEDLIYVSREVGNTWSCYWDDDRPSLQSFNECVPVSTELSLYTPPETPAEAIIKDCSLDIVCSDNNVATNSVNHSTIVSGVQSVNIVDNLNHGKYCSTSDTQINNNCNIENLNINDEDNLCITDVQELKNIENITESIETPKSELEKNISILEDNTSINKINLGKHASKVQLTVKNENVLLIKNIDKKQDHADTTDLKKEGGQSTEKSTTSNLRIKTIEIDGLPPVSLSYQVPASLLPTTISNKRTNNSTTQCVNNSQSIDTSLSSAQSSGTHKLLTMINRQSTGQNVHAAKRYEKFHFNAIKKKIETANTNDSLSSNNKCLLNSNKGSSNNKGTDQIQKQDSSKVITSGSSIDTNKSIKIEAIKSEPTALENGTIDSSMNLDTLLDDFMKDESLYDKVNENYILPDMDDDWINSLLQ